MLREVLTVGELRLLAAREASGVAGGWRRRPRRRGRPAGSWGQRAGGQRGRARPGEGTGH